MLNQPRRWLLFCNEIAFMTSTFSSTHSSECGCLSFLLSLLALPVTLSVSLSLSHTHTRTRSLIPSFTHTHTSPSFPHYPHVRQIRCEQLEADIFNLREISTLQEARCSELNALLVDRDQTLEIAQVSGEQFGLIILITSIWRMAISIQTGLDVGRYLLHLNLTHSLPILPPFLYLSLFLSVSPPSPPPSLPPCPPSPYPPPLTQQHIPYMQSQYNPSITPPCQSILTHNYHYWFRRMSPGSSETFCQRWEKKTSRPLNCSWTRRRRKLFCKSPCTECLWNFKYVCVFFFTCLHLLGFWIFVFVL